MPINITMPALSPTMEEGTLAKWLVKEGDSVSPGDIIAEIETDKATMEVEAVDEGTVAKILVEGGTEGVKVNALIAVLAEEGEDASSVEAAPESAAPQAAPAVEEEKVVEEKVAAAPAAPVASPAPVVYSGTRTFSSPLARRIAKDAGLDISTMTGTGPKGRVVKKDVEAAIAGGAKPAGKTIAMDPAPLAVAKGMGDDAILGLYEEGAYELLPHDGMRKAIASRLTESTQTIPSYTVNMECRLDTLMALRAQINKGAPVVDEKPQFKISVNDFIIKAMALALQQVPMANASWTSTARVLHQHSDVGVAVAIDDGLITPIVRNAETKTLSAISAEVKDLAGRARNKKLAPSEYQGGNTAVSNLGMFGVSDFTSIINPPQASIVSIGAGRKVPVVGDDGELTVGMVMNATFAFDHRVIDGALGAELAVAFKSYIENPMSMLV